MRNYAEPGLTYKPPGKGGLWVGAVWLALGGVSLALAIDNSAVADEVAFASRQSRIAFGVVGAAIALFGIRVMFRALNGSPRQVTPQSLRRNRIFGWVLILVGLWYEIPAWSDGTIRIGLGFDWWAGPVFGLGGIFLMLQGLALQVDPTRWLRRERVLEGDGTIVTATILRATDLGSLKGKAKVQVEMTMDLGGTVEHHSAKTLLDRSTLARIEGATVDVVVDRADPTVWVVKWDTLREGAGPGS